MNTQQLDMGFVPAEFERPELGPEWKPADACVKFPLTRSTGWQSNGGPTRGHPGRSLPFSLEITVPHRAEALLRIHLVGVFAVFANRECEAPGTVGATIQLRAGDGDSGVRFDLVNGRHYEDATSLDVTSRLLGDGTSVESIGACEIFGIRHRVDVLTLDVPTGIRPRKLLFKDLNSPASFVLFDVLFEFAGPCRDREQKGSLCLAELGTAVRICDRLRFARALEELDHGIDDAEDLDTAKVAATTFLAVVGAALMETTSVPGVDRQLVDALREIDRAPNRSALKGAVDDRLRDMTQAFFAPSESASDRLMDRALSIIDRHYAKDLTDSMVAAQLGLSTSHFRFLFRQATGHPFHKYVVALRLEKAKQMLIEQELPVSQVAAAVGFTGLSHFSRAFTQRFSASPSHIRRAAG